jgi:regulator of cell morphogenesis and NO signaling
MPSFPLTPETPVGEIVLAHPFLSRQFETHGLDYCCGGKSTLAEACARRSIPVLEFIGKLEAARIQAGVEEISLAHGAKRLEPNASLTTWIEHIRSVHHAYLWEELPALSLLVEKVARVHGSSDARLIRLSQHFSPFADDLMRHMQKEERVLFPWIESLEKDPLHAPIDPAASHCGGIQNPIRQMEAEHDEAGGVLREIRLLTTDFSLPEWACNSYRAMLNRLHHLETDLHMHVHLENNWLFPRAMEIQQSWEPKPDTALAQG